MATSQVAWQADRAKKRGELLHFRNKIVYGRDIYVVGERPFLASNQAKRRVEIVNFDITCLILQFLFFCYSTIGPDHLLIPFLSYNVSKKSKHCLKFLWGPFKKPIASFTFFNNLDYRLIQMMIIEKRER